MILSGISKNNIKNLDASLQMEKTTSVTGVSGSGKTTFCTLLYDEYKRRLTSLLPKLERDYMFPSCSRTEFGSFGIVNLPPIKFFHQSAIIGSQRSTIGTRSGVFKNIRRFFGKAHSISPQFFSFNCNMPGNEEIICPKCKGRGSFGGLCCPVCKGSRYSAAVSRYAVTLAGKRYTIADLHALSMGELLDLAQAMELPHSDVSFLDLCIKFDIGYLSLDRTIKTLSGGECTRLKLAESVAASIGYLVIVDELSQGLDKVSADKLLRTLSNLGDENLLWLIDHSHQIIESAERNISFGPGSGANGGKLLSRIDLPKAVDIPYPPLSHGSAPIRFRNLSCRNIQIRELELPRFSTIAITGVSGCGKSTLVRECIIPQLEDVLPNCKALFIEQGKAQSVTNKSTIATFLGLSDIIRHANKNIRIQDCRFCLGTGINDFGTQCQFCGGTGKDYRQSNIVFDACVTIGELYTLSIDQLLVRLPKGNIMYDTLSRISRLGIGHLSLERSIRTLSAGEFQSIYLISCLQNVEHGQEYVLFLDEPTKGLSQNIVNQFMTIINELITDYPFTVVYIEHNEYMIRNASYVMDFGYERKKIVTELHCIESRYWQPRHISSTERYILHSKPILTKGIEELTMEVAGKAFQSAERQYLSTMREFSSTADWILGGYAPLRHVPAIAIDFSKRLYSPHTHLYEISRLVSKLVKTTSDNSDVWKRFDYLDVDSRCLSCKGSGVIKVVDFDLCMEDQSKAWNRGLFNSVVTRNLKSYDFSRVHAMFADFKNITGMNLGRAFDKLSPEEQKILLYGDWKYMLDGGKGGGLYMWRGLNFLIQKYIRNEKGEMKALIQKSTHECTCPVCGGRGLKHTEPLLFNGREFSTYLAAPLEEVYTAFGKPKAIAELMELCGKKSLFSSDVSELDVELQSLLKLYEIEQCGFCGFSIYLKGLPINGGIRQAELLQKLSVNNRVFICGTANVATTQTQFEERKQTVREYLTKDKKLERSLRGYKRTAKCEACAGKGRVTIVSEDPNIDNLYETCEICSGSGISPSLYDEVVCNRPLKIWLFGMACDIAPNLPDIPLGATLAELSPDQLQSLSSKK